MDAAGMCDAKVNKSYKGNRLELSSTNCSAKISENRKPKFTNSQRQSRDVMLKTWRWLSDAVGYWRKDGRRRTTSQRARKMFGDVKHNFNRKSNREIHGFDFQACLLSELSSLLIRIIKTAAFKDVKARFSLSLSLSLWFNNTLAYYCKNRDPLQLPRFVRERGMLIRKSFFHARFTRARTFQLLSLSLSLARGTQFR